MTLDVAMEKYYGLIHSYIYGKTGKNESFADECSNSIFFLFSQKGSKLDDQTVYPWLMKTASNKTKEYFRSIGREKAVTYLEDITSIPADDTDITDILVTDEEIEEAKERLLSLLSPEKREMYECYFVQKMTYIEIAKRFGIDRNTASKRVRAIRKMLEEEAHKIFSVSGAAIILRIIEVLFD